MVKHPQTSRTSSHRPELRPGSIWTHPGIGRYPYPILTAPAPTCESPFRTSQALGSPPDAILRPKIGRTQSPCAAASRAVISPFSEVHPSLWLPAPAAHSSPSHFSSPPAPSSARSSTRRSPPSPPRDESTLRDSPPLLHQRLLPRRAELRRAAEHRQDRQGHLRRRHPRHAPRPRSALQFLRPQGLRPDARGPARQVLRRRHDHPASARQGRQDQDRRPPSLRRHALLQGRHPPRRRHPHRRRQIHRRHGLRRRRLPAQRRPTAPTSPSP